MRVGFLAAVLFAAVVQSGCSEAQSPSEEDDAGPMTKATFSAFQLRNIGPALMSGRISDIDFHPNDPATWYVGVGSGGVWKTENAGTTWTPIFDGRDVYSIGAIALDPSNPDVVWVGTGENVGGRHVAWGDGIHRSRDGGSSWEHLGLDDTGHISQILVHPNDPNTVWVAAQGPLWSSGGERGLFKTTDGGETWDNVLSAGEWTGVTDIVMDPRDPNRLVAATWQRHRTVAAYMGGGPESGLHVSEDGGETWRKLSRGLPSGNVGKIGLAISPINPDVLYAGIELERREGGFYRSEDRGESWTKMSNAVSGGTGPHYYQEVFANPHHFDRVYLVSNTTQYSEDGGKTFKFIDNEFKHVDDHAIAFHPTDPDYVMFGSDGGLYESFDGMETWRYIANLPVTQFYKIAVDDAEPFYNVYGGTQDNSTQVGPSRTLNRHGIRNSDWEIVVFADGHQPATEPGNPDIAYGQWQQGNLVRFDRTTGEIVFIKPQGEPGDPAERFNWDAPILVSAHDPQRLYHGSQRLWRSDNRGDTWTALSDDLTRDQDRMLLPLMDRQWSWEASWDLFAMSTYNTITSIAESPVDQNRLYVGTDDGLIQASSDGGATWTEIEVGDLPGVPDTAFVNDIKADLFEANTVYVALDNHKYGDFEPYLLKSTDGGVTWSSIAEALPDDHIVWRIVQDHVDADLMFVGTEFGVFFTVDGGEDWVELSGAPTISMRDLAIQRRENDLVAGSFGRGIFVLDDYTPLREVDADALEDEALLFEPRRAWWYHEEHPLGFSEGASQGHSYYRASNPPYGSVLTYYLPEGLQSLAAIRKEEEKPLIEEGEDTPFPGFDAIEQERREARPEIWLTIRDGDGEVVRRLPGPTGKGFHRVAWNLRVPPTGPVTGPPSAREPGEDAPSGHLVAPGVYTATLSQRVRGETTQLAGPVEVRVERLREGALPAAAPDDVVAFWERATGLQERVSAANAIVSDARRQLSIWREAINRAEGDYAALDDQWQAIRTEVFAIDEALNGNRSAQGFGPQPTTVGGRLSFVMTGTMYATYGPTPEHERQLGFAEEEFTGLRTRVNTLVEETMPAFEEALDAAGAPWRSGGRAPLP